MIIRRFALVSSLIVLSSLGFSTVARAGAGAVAGSAVLALFPASTESSLIFF